MNLHLVGGFLGSGKTTAIIGAARLLVARGLRVGVVTNDQGKYLVDTAFFQAAQLPTVEVTGGCFCCNYDDLSARLEQLRGAAHPDVVFAESVGSCADLVATVLKPLLALAQGLAPASFSVFADCRLLRRRLLDEPMPFSDEVVYVFDQQIEEAGLLVVNKTDLLPQPALAQLRELAAQRWPEKKLLLHSATPLTPAGLPQQPVVTLSTAKGLDANFEMLRSAQHDKNTDLTPGPSPCGRGGATNAVVGAGARGVHEGRSAACCAPTGEWLALIESGGLALPHASLRMDYPRYGAGEARLAWLDMQIELDCREGEGRDALLRLLEGIRAGLSARGAGLGHLKLAVGGIKLSLTSLDDPAWREQAPQLPAGRQRLLLNARAELPPGDLLALAQAALAACGAAFTIERVDSFAPGFPKPTHRMD